MNAARAYRSTQQETASPEQLMVLLFEAALRHTRLGIAALEAGRPQEAIQPLTKASNIVLHLKATLRTEVAPKLCKDLRDVYEFVAWRLTRAALAKDVKLAKDAERVFAPVADAFGEAVRMVAGGH